MSGCSSGGKRPLMPQLGCPPMEKPPFPQAIFLEIRKRSHRLRPWPRGWSLRCFWNVRHSWPLFQSVGRKGYSPAASSWVPLSPTGRRCSDSRRRWWPNSNFFPAFVLSAANCMPCGSLRRTPGNKGCLRAPQGHHALEAPRHCDGSVSGPPLFQAGRTGQEGSARERNMEGVVFLAAA